MRILVADDVADAANTLADLLRLEGHETFAVHSGAEVLDCIGEFRPQVLFCNLSMPLVDGFAVARQIRERPELRDVVLVAWSGFTSLEVREQAAEAGFIYFLAKPTQPRDFFVLLERIAADLP